MFSSDFHQIVEKSRQKAWHETLEEISTQNGPPKEN